MFFLYSLYCIMLFVLYYVMPMCVCVCVLLWVAYPSKYKNQNYSFKNMQTLSRFMQTCTFIKVSKACVNYESTHLRWRWLSGWGNSAVWTASHWGTREVIITRGQVVCTGLNLSCILYSSWLSYIHSLLRGTRLPCWQLPNLEKESNVLQC